MCSDPQLPLDCLTGIRPNETPLNPTPTQEPSSFTRLSTPRPIHPKEPTPPQDQQLISFPDHQLLCSDPKLPLDSVTGVQTSQSNRTRSSTQSAISPFRPTHPEEPTPPQDQQLISFSTPPSGSITTPVPQPKQIPSYSITEPVVSPLDTPLIFCNICNRSFNRQWELK